MVCHVTSQSRSCCGNSSHGELIPHGLALLHRLEVVVKEVDVEASLEHGRQRLCPAEKALDLVSVDPVEDVEEAVQTEAGDVMAGQVLDDAHFVKHDDLWDEGDSFKPDGERPEPGPGGPSSVQNACQYSGHRE